MWREREAAMADLEFQRELEVHVYVYVCARTCTTTLHSAACIVHDLASLFPNIACMHVRSGYMTLIGVHELHRQMHPDQGSLFTVDPLSLFGCHGRVSKCVCLPSFYLPNTSSRRPH